jgi:hypothetical protein
MGKSAVITEPLSGLESTDTATASNIGPKYSSLLAALIFGIGVCTLIFSTWVVVESYSPVPFWDQWSVFDILMKDNGHVDFGKLWAQHNEHRAVVQNLLCLADLFFFGGKNISLLVEILLVQLAQAILFIFVIRRSPLLSPAWFYTLSGLAVAFFFSPLQMENFTWGYQTGFLFCQLGVATAVACALFYPTIPDEYRWRKRILFLFMILSGCAAEGSLASGLLVWPFLIVLFWTGGYSRLHKAVILVWSTVMIYAYMRDYQSPPYHGNPLKTVQAPARILKYVLTYLGFTWDRALPNPSAWPIWSELLSGLAILALVAIAIKALRRRFKCAPVELFLLFNGLFALASAIMTSLGRLTFGYDQATGSRYQSIAVIFWFSVIALGAMQIPKTFWRTSVAVQVPIAILLAGNIARWNDMETFAVGRRNIEITAWSALANNRFQDASLLNIYPDRTNLVAFYGFMRAEGFGFAANAPKLPVVVPGDFGTPRVAGIPTLTNQCAGFIDIATTFGDEAKISGWAYDFAANTAPDHVVLVSSTGEIVATTVPSTERLDVTKAVPNVRTSRVGWTASVPLKSITTLRAFAVNEHLHTGCALGNGVRTQ